MCKKHFQVILDDPKLHRNRIVFVFLRQFHQIVEKDIEIPPDIVQVHRAYIQKHIFIYISTNSVPINCDMGIKKTGKQNMPFTLENKNIISG